jgi:phage repressor protein C with HTH and peptisase S24 domain
MTDTSFRQRLLEDIDRTGITIAELSRRSGVSYDVLNKLKRGSSQSTSAENAAKISSALGWDQDFALGDQMPSEPPPPPNWPGMSEKDQHPYTPALVPVFDVHASAGHGAFSDAEQEVYSLAFPPSYLKRLTSSAPSNLAIISVKGESMEPTLLDDDIVLLDASKTNLSYDGLFVLRFDDALHVKRVGRAPKKGHVNIISDNKELYPPMLMQVGEVEAVGKVLWYGRKV